MINCIFYLSLIFWISDFTAVGLEIDFESLGLNQIERSEQQLAFNVLKSLIVPAGEKLFLRSLNPEIYNELEKAHRLIVHNFKMRPEYRAMAPEIIELYMQANTPDNLRDSLQKDGTICFVIADQMDDFKGIVLAQYNYYPNGDRNMQICRLHASLSSNGYKGIGKTLLNACALHAYAHNVQILMTTASMPAQSFFENLGWQGSVIQTPYPILRSDSVASTILLPQYQCQFLLTPQFQGF